MRRCRLGWLRLRCFRLPQVRLQQLIQPNPVLHSALPIVVVRQQLAVARAWFDFVTPESAELSSIARDMRDQLRVVFFARKIRPLRSPRGEEQSIERVMPRPDQDQDEHQDREIQSVTHCPAGYS